MHTAGRVSSKSLKSLQILNIYFLGYYGICLASYPHADVVNSVAFSKNDQMLITTSDDYEIKIWRSQAAIREQGIAGISRANEFKNKPRKR